MKWTFVVLIAALISGCASPRIVQYDQAIKLARGYAVRDEDCAVYYGPLTRRDLIFESIQYLKSEHAHLVTVTFLLRDGPRPMVMGEGEVITVMMTGEGQFLGCTPDRIPGSLSVRPESGR